MEFSVSIFLFPTKIIQLLILVASILQSTLFFSSSLISFYHENPPSMVPPVSSICIDPQWTVPNRPFFPLSAYKLSNWFRNQVA